MRLYHCAAVMLLLILLLCACNSGRSGPQDPELNPAGPAADTVAPMPLLGGFPAPAELRQVSWSPLDHLAYGSLYIEAWPHANVDNSAPPLGTFSSQWHSQPAPAFDDLAYALYGLEVSPDATPLLATSWTTPPEALGCYIGLANQARNAWDWFACTGGDISLPPLAAYLDSGSIMLAVVVLEQGPLELEWLRIGDNLPPDPRMYADAEFGYAPATIEFTLDSSLDPELDIALYEIDFDGDGTYDYSSPDTPLTPHTYNTPGSFTAVGRVTDGGGASATAEVDVHVSGFAPQQIDAAGYSPSIAIDPVSDAPKISYSGGAQNNVLRLATIEDPVDIRNMTTVSGEENIETALVLTASATEFAYGRTELHYALDAGAFTMTLVDPDKGAGKPAIVSDGEGETSIFYSHLAGSFPLQTAHFYRAYGYEDTWDFEQLDPSEPTGQYCDAVYEGYLTCAYAADEEQDNGRLMFGFYSTIDGWTWVTAREDTHRYNSRVSLAINPTDHMPRMAYISNRDGSGGYHDATYAWYAEDDWLTETVHEFAWDSDLALDGAGNPHLICSVKHISPAHFKLWYHWHDGSEWHAEYVAETAEGDVKYIELALDTSDTPHLCWTFTPEGSDASELWYAAPAD